MCTSETSTDTAWLLAPVGQRRTRAEFDDGPYRALLAPPGDNRRDERGALRPATDFPLAARLDRYPGAVQRAAVFGLECAFPLDLIAPKLPPSRFWR